MSRCLRLSLACLVFSLLSISLVAQAPPSDDTYVTRANPTANYGSGPILAVQEGTTTYVQFDLSAVPAGVSIRKGTMRLYVNSVLTPGTFDVYQVNDRWSESTLSYNNAPPVGESATGGKGIDVSEASLNHFIMVDITPLMQDWANGAPNNGVALALAGGPTTNSGSFSFDSKETQPLGHQPELQFVLDGEVLCASPIVSEIAKFCKMNTTAGCCLCSDTPDSKPNIVWCKTYNPLTQRSSTDCGHFCARGGWDPIFEGGWECKKEGDPRRAH